MKGSNSATIRVLEVDEANLLRWTVMLYPVFLFLIIKYLNVAVINGAKGFSGRWSFS